MKSWIVKAGCVVALAVAVAGCSAAQEIPVQPRPLPSGVSYTGKWYSPQYEDMVLTQKGDAVEGEFTYKGGGTLKGTLDGHLLIFDWVQPGNKQEARQEVRGRGYFALSEDGEHFQGEWGYGDSMLGGGVWNGDRLSERQGPSFDPNDPVF